MSSLLKTRSDASISALMPSSMVEVRRLIDEPLDLADGQRSALGDLVADLVGGGRGLAGGYDPDDEADALCFVRVDDPAGQ